MPFRAGKLRPSQAVTQFGPGALIDMPKLSMVVAGADTWLPQFAARIDEPRLARRLDVDYFRRPPYFHRRADQGGVPAFIFPRYLVCPNPDCRRVARYTEFELDERASEYRCRECGVRNGVAAHPARFMVACPRGHLSDFPWGYFVHGAGGTCNGRLELRDTGETGSISDLIAVCSCGDKKSMANAYGANRGRHLPVCDGERPWLDDSEEGCGQELRVLLRGASNAYFPVTETAISIPPWSDPVAVALAPLVDVLANVENEDQLEQARRLLNLPDLEPFSTEQIWNALQQFREGAPVVRDLREEEWLAVTATRATTIDPRAQFQARRTEVPPALQELCGGVVLVERLREVRALRGLTRIDPIPDIGDLQEIAALERGMAPVARRRARWYPGIDLRGEGIFLQLNESAVSDWERRDEVRRLTATHLDMQRAWHASRALEMLRERSARYLLLHTLSHMLIRQFSLDCGYSAGSLTERIYSSSDEQAMAGILIYTATPDSDGSLGGLVEMGRRENLGELVNHALRDAELCAGDPFCSHRAPSPHRGDLNGAACHSCVLISETACEAGNRYLDRATVVRTLADAGTEFFGR